MNSVKSDWLEKILRTRYVKLHVAAETIEKQPKLAQDVPTRSKAITQQPANRYSSNLRILREQLI